MDTQPHNNTESTDIKTDKQYFLSEEESWAYCPYQRFFAKSINEPLPQHWELALLNKNTNFQHEYINFYETKQLNKKAHDSNASMKNLVSSSLSSSSVSPLNSFNSTFSRLKLNESHSNSTVSEDEENDSFELPKPIHVKVEPKFTKSNKSNKANMLNQISNPLYLGSFTSNKDIFHDEKTDIPTEISKNYKFNHVEKVNKTNKIKNRKSGLKLITTT